jgi:subtilisin-like proprotein convertase family protein
MVSIPNKALRVIARASLQEVSVNHHLAACQRFLISLQLPHQQGLQLVLQRLFFKLINNYHGLIFNMYWRCLPPAQVRIDFHWTAPSLIPVLDPKDPSWFKNGAGAWVSHDFGFGIPNATRAVLIARDFTTTLIERIIHYDAPLTEQGLVYFLRVVFSTRKLNFQIGFVPSNALAKHLKLVNSKLPFEYIAALPPAGFSAIVIGVIDVAESLILHHVELVVKIHHSNRGILLDFLEICFFSNSILAGHLDIRLISPSGTVCIMAESHADKNADYNNWKFTSRFYWGEQERGNWTLIIKDAVPFPLFVCKTR